MKDQRYAPDAYFFVREGLDFTAKMLSKPQEGPGRHIKGKELLEGLRRFTLQEFGPMSLRVLNTWGIKRTDDFGEIVFNLVESGKLGKTDEDKREDFAGGYDFTEVFVKPFKPTTQPRWMKNMNRKVDSKRKRAPRKTNTTKA